MSTTPRTNDKWRDAKKKKCLHKAFDVMHVHAAELETELQQANSQLALRDAQIAELNQRLIERTEAQLAKNAELQREVNALRSWKEQQMAVEKDWNPQELAKMLGGALGVSCRKTIQEKVPELIARNEWLRCSLEVAVVSIQSWCDSVDADASWDGWDTDFKECKYEIIPSLKQALSAPPPALVPLSQYDELKADAEALVGLLYLACFGSCTCETKTPEILHHSNSCSFRVYSEAIATFRAKHQQEKEGA